MDVTSKTEGKVDNSHMLVKYDARLRDNVAVGVVQEITDTVQVCSRQQDGQPASNGDDAGLAVAVSATLGKQWACLCVCCCLYYRMHVAAYAGMPKSRIAVVSATLMHRVAVKAACRTSAACCKQTSSSVQVEATALAYIDTAMGLLCGCVILLNNRWQRLGSTSTPA